MKKVAVFTTTRAEFGILSPLIKKLINSQEISPLLFVGGAHLSKKFGNTIHEITNSGFRITDTFDYLFDQSDSFYLSKGLSRAMDKVSHIFQKYEFDFACVVGDRYELLSIVSNAILFKRAIIHIHGGERSEGAIDEQIRHMITKASHLHFVCCEEYASNVKKMGESQWRIFNVGALGIDNIVKSENVPMNNIFKILHLDPNKPTALLTYHPVTLEFNISPTEQIKNIFEVLSLFDLQVVVTAPNNEVDRDQIISIIKERVGQNTNYFYFDSLGTKNYHTLVSNCEFVMGNSSSGIIEVPFFKIPTVNIGDRQNGRVRHESVIDADYSIQSIKDAVKLVLSQEFKKNLENMSFKFGDGHAAERMVEIIKDIKIDQGFMRKSLSFPDE